MMHHKAANHREMLSIYGLGQTYLELLNRVGIFSVDQLRLCDAADLRTQIGAVVDTFNIGRIPSRANVEDWIDQSNTIYFHRRMRV